MSRVREREGSHQCRPSNADNSRTLTYHEQTTRKLYTRSGNLTHDTGAAIIVYHWWYTA